MNYIVNPWYNYDKNTNNLRTNKENADQNDIEALRYIATYYWMKGDNEMAKYYYKKLIDEKGNSFSYYMGSEYFFSLRNYVPK